MGNYSVGYRFEAILCPRLGRQRSKNRKISLLLPIDMITFRIIFCAKKVCDRTRTPKGTRKEQTRSISARNRGTARQRINPEIYSQTLQHHSSQPVKLDQKAPDQKTKQLKILWWVTYLCWVRPNDRVAAAMERMDLPQIYRKSQKTLHTSSDGQKFEVRQPSLNASHSFKYFGQGQGVSAYTFIDERNLLWYSLVFSASERESAYPPSLASRCPLSMVDIISSLHHPSEQADRTLTFLCFCLIIDRARRPPDGPYRSVL